MRSGRCKVSGGDSLLMIEEGLFPWIYFLAIIISHLCKMF